MKDTTAEVLSIEGREVRVTHPDKPYFSKQTKLSKLDLVRYYLSVAPGALGGIRDRPLVLKRFVDGAEGQAFYQKRAPAKRPAWLRTVTLTFPSGRKAEEIVVDDAAGLAWVVNLGCIELHPHPVRSGDLEHPDELRVDLDPNPGVGWDDVRRVALEVKSFLEEMGLRGWPKTSGSRGMHVNVRIEQRWTFVQVRRAALTLSRAVERRAPSLASSKWWKEERHGVFLDYNQNAKDRTTCSAYSVRPLPDARVSTPLHWHKVPACEPADFTVLTVPKRLAGRQKRGRESFIEPGGPKCDRCHGEMPRRPRLATGGIAYHVLNRRVGRLPLFEKPGDYSAFEKVLGEAYERTNVRIAAYCLMPNHWHLLLWPRDDGELSEVDHSDAYATLACPSAFVGQRAGLSGSIQVLSGSDRRAPS